MRKLASIQKVLEIVPIEGADFIELVKINGWQAVVSKGEFTVGDLGVFFEIDSIPPDIDIFKFLWTTKDNLEGIRPDKFRLKTKRLKGFLSQGLMMPIRKIIDGYGFDLTDQAIAFGFTFVEGDDVTEVLRIEKYDPPVPLGADIIGNWNFYCPKTDEERVQSCPGVVAEMQELPYVITEKLDGRSLTIGIDKDGQLAVSSRNYALNWRDTGNVYEQIIQRYDLESKLSSSPFSYLVFQGELCGPGIQKNCLNLKTPDWYIFNVWRNDECEYLPWSLAEEYISEIGLKSVSTVASGEDFRYSMENLLAMAPGTYPGTTNKREGIVVRPRLGEFYSPTLNGRLSFKVISNEFLLSEKD